MQTPANLNLEPTLLGAAWRYKWLVLFTTIAFGALAFWYADNGQTWTATTTLAVQDPRSSIVFDQDSTVDPERYVADQIEIARSRAVGQLALEELAALEPPIAIPIDTYLENVVVSAAQFTDLLTISYSDPDADVAVVVANAIADAYQATTAKGAATTFADALTELDASIAARTAELRAAEATLSELEVDDPEQVAIAADLQEAIDAVLNFEQPPATAEQEEIDAANAQLTELQARVDLLQVALGTFEEDDRITNLQQEQDDIRSRLSALRLRRDQLAVDAELAGNIVVFSSPAETAEPSSPLVLVALGSMGGAILGGIVAQSFARRRNSFHDRSHPKSVLETDLIADIPLFADERLSTDLPTKDAPQSASAEAFRFVATGIQLRQQASAEHPFKTVVVASATLADGKTTVTANTAFAAARSGRRIALIDADFVNPSLTRLLTPDMPHANGLTDVGIDDVTLDDVGQPIPTLRGGEITLFQRGTRSGEMLEFFASPKAGQLLREIEETYDLVLIDAPPVLRLAHSGTVVRLADRVMIVVAHRSDISVSEELQRYLSVVGVPVLGYVYNFAPLRREMLGRGGSTARYPVVPDIAETGPAGANEAPETSPGDSDG